jgi:16S rRNA (uracil1498-N3)-methyltransferase
MRATVFWTFIDAAQMSNGRVTIGGPQGHHLARVLRVHPGERGVAVANGREYQLEVVDAAGGRMVARILGDRPVQGEAKTAVTLLQAVLPNPDFDAVVEAGTAVGIRRFIAVQAHRSISRPPSGRLARWQVIAGAAAEQSHRGEVPAVSGPMSLADALGQVGGGRLLVLEPAAAMPLAEARDGSPAYTIAVGPEGGWTDGELSTLREQGGVPVNLGPRILRARLAPIVAAAILVQRS